MSKIQLIKPSIVYEGQIKEYRNEFLQSKTSMDGTSFLADYEEIEKWLDCIKMNSNSETVAEGLVQATQFLAVRGEDQLLVGMISVRHELNDYLARIGGHIGYSVRPSFWGKGYAKEMLKRSLDFCRQLGLEKVLVTCDQSNFASRKVILSNGGVFEGEVEDDEIVERYWINL
ncbi:GNAT family N-acetyltransferase [Enterococcus sp. LJL128]